MIEILLGNPLFRGTSPDELAQNIEGISYQIKSYKKGDILAFQGDVCNKLIILLKGSVRGEMIDYSGKLIKIEDIHAPRALAPLFLFGTENKYPVEVTANEDVEALSIPKESILILFQRNKRFLENYLNTSANYAKTISDKLFFLSFKNIKQKLASYILRLSASAGDKLVMDRSQQELADYFGVSRPSLARELANMQEEGLITVDRKHIAIINKEKLKEMIR
ncbi:Crp/Fnr family transcriptional regulator [Bacteroides sedimenti]|uniref:Transcriptional regulator n=1 Tax=Bacteroides sedimenti TaxID=2136147 RepID=A0ABM8IA90_9BACE